MTISINGSGTITGLTAGGLPDGTVQPSDLSTGAPTWDTSGNVGIGTSSPSRKLDVQSAIAATYTTANDIQLLMNASASTVNISATYNTTGSYVPLAFYTNGSERARIDTSGNLLVGSTTVTAGAARIQSTFDGAARNGVDVRTTYTGGTSYLVSFFNNANTNVGSIVYNLSSVAYNTSSDYRLKENIAPMTGALSVVQALKPVTYTWKADGSNGQGFIAHELQAVVPDCVTGEKDAVDAEGNPVYQGIDTSFLVATLTAAIQELKAELDAAKDDIAALKGTA